MLKEYQHSILNIKSQKELYLSDIEIPLASFCDYKSFFPNNEQYALMKKLTKEKFDKKHPLPYKNELYLYHNTIGMMPAAWCNDTILIKRPAPAMELDKWKKILSEELVFKNGKLISREITDIY